MIKSKMKKTHRILDPIHGLIHFNEENETDDIAWQLINGLAFQRLRRIKQLGFADFVFPAATHSRFAHSIGVFYMARVLIAKMKQQLGKSFDERKANATAWAALLHDIGHGAFSHAFEKCEARCGKAQKHESWTIAIIREDKLIHETLTKAGLLNEVIAMVEPQTDNLYQAVISSAFDADRLDYLQRDKYMCGVGMGGFDSEWLLDCLEVSAAGYFNLNKKSEHNAEEYLLARYHLHSSVYTHKTIRAAEMMLSDILFTLSQSLTASGLAKEHPLYRYYENRSVETYLALDDIVMWNALGEMRQKAKTEELRTLAGNLIDRNFYKCFDVGALAEKEEHGAERLGNYLHALREKNDKCVIDTAEITAYPPNNTRGRHDGIRIDGVDIASLSPIIRAIPIKKLCRIYAMTEKDINFAQALWKKL